MRGSTMHRAPWAPPTVRGGLTPPPGDMHALMTFGPLDGSYRVYDALSPSKYWQPASGSRAAAIEADGIVGDCLRAFQQPGDDHMHAAVSTAGDVWDIPAATDVTLACWMRPTTGDGCIAQWDEADFGGFYTEAWRLDAGASGVRFRMRTAAGTSDTGSVGGNKPANEWTHAAVTLDRNGNARVYKDGVFAGLVDISAHEAETFTGASGHRLRTGYRKNNGSGSGGYYTDSECRFDECALWRRVLTEDEIAAVYKWGAAGLSLERVAP